MEHKTYLVQAARFRPIAEQQEPWILEKKKGIDLILKMSYMGAAEFEFGALPESLDRIRKNIGQYTQFQYSFSNEPTKVVTVFCKKTDEVEVLASIQGLADGNIHTKCGCDLKGWVYPKKQFKAYNDNDFWWDVDNDFMFWKFEPDFDLVFKEKIKVK